MASTVLTYTALVPLQLQSQHSEIAKTAIANCAAMGPPPTPPPPGPTTSNPLINITNLDAQEFQIPKPAFRTYLAPPPTALGSALQAVNMGGGQAFDHGVGHPPSDTPMGSRTPSTAPSSPRMSVNLPP